GAALCSRHGIPTALLADPSATTPLDPILGALEELLERTRHRSLGLRLAAQASLDTYHTPALILLASECLRAGLQRAFQFQRLWGDGDRFALQSAAELGYAGPGLAVTFATPGAWRPAHGILEVCALAECAGAVRGLSGRPAEPALAIGLTRPSDDVGLLAEHFGVTPQLGVSRAYCVWSDEVLDLPLSTAHELFRGIFERQARSELDALPPVDDLLARVRAEIRRGLARGHFALADSARVLGTSARTLERRLVERGTHHRDLVEQVRREQALRWLTEQRPIDEVAVLLGYAERASFHRACVRWFGKTPAELGRDPARGGRPGR
ncbi:MAG TPA: AraC family transcriptional regulator ligand-binding domain-containing protein, partial [Polyangiaceae bacterium]|nr:AraC family transcriptional regulator ligand-binding domain-containing protein [Polyangiaceae bacterium]